MNGSRLDRRFFLLSLGSSGALAACGGGRHGLLPARSSSLGTMMSGANLVIDATQTDLVAKAPGTKIYAYIIGKVPGATYHITSSGSAQLIATTDNVWGNGTGNPSPSASFPSSMSGLTSAQIAALASNSNYPTGPSDSPKGTGWADYSIPIPLGSTTTIPFSGISSIPALGTGTSAFSGRIYLSIGTPILPFVVQGPDQYAQPVVGPNQLGSLTLFDWIEFSYDSAGNFNGNTTQVDQFGFELHLSSTPAAKNGTQGVLNAGRSTIISSIQALPSPFGGPSSVIPVPAAGLYPVTGSLRALSPKTIAGENCYRGPLASYFDPTIAAWYKALQGAPIVVTEQSGVGAVYSGFVPTTGTYAGMLIFYSGTQSISALQASYSSGTLPSFAITGATNDVITSADIWECSNSLATGSTDAKNVQKQIAAAFNRGQISGVVSPLNDASCPAPTSYYQAGSACNQWSNSFHGFNTNALAYGFAYDDVCNQSPSIDVAATTITVTLGNLLS